MFRLLWRAGYLDRRYLSVLKSMGRGFKLSYLASKPVTEVGILLREQSFSTCSSEIEPLSVGWTLLLVLLYPYSYFQESQSSTSGRHGETARPGTLHPYLSLTL